MAERIRHLWLYRALFLGLAVLVIFVQLLPLHPGPGKIPGPDVLLLLALSWVFMRQEFVPLIAVAAIFLLADIFFMRPFGLWAALAVVAVEYLRHRVHQWHTAAIQNTKRARKLGRIGAARQLFDKWHKLTGAKLLSLDDNL